MLFAFKNIIAADDIRVSLPVQCEALHYDDENGIRRYGFRGMIIADKGGSVLCCDERRFEAKFPKSLIMREFRQP